MLFLPMIFPTLPINSDIISEYRSRTYTRAWHMVNNEQDDGSQEGMIG
jgi:hypothetical protein